MKTLRIILILLVALCLSGCKHEQTEDIIILYTNDVAGELHGNVTYAEVKAYKDYMESENKYVSLVDAGDFLDGYISSISDGEYIVEIMNAVGYDFVAVGNQEFSNGLKELKNNIKNSAFIYLSCNLKYLGNWFNPLRKIKRYAIKNYGGTRIAFIGVTTPETLKPGKSSRTALTDENGELLYSLYEGNEGLDLYTQVQKTVNKVRNRVDYVIVLSHLGQNSVTEGFSSYDLIENTRGIDVVIDGHSHTPNSGEAVYNLDGDMVVLTSTQEKLEYLGELRIHPDHTYTTVIYPSISASDEGIEELTARIESQVYQ